MQKLNLDINDFKWVKKGDAFIGTIDIFRHPKFTHIGSFKPSYLEITVENKETKNIGIFLWKESYHNDPDRSTYHWYQISQFPTKHVYLKLVHV